MWSPVIAVLRWIALDCIALTLIPLHGRVFCVLWLSVVARVG